MLRIAVCDDDPRAVASHIKITEDCLRQLQVPGELTPYTDSGSLLADIADDGFYFDLILLDIEMPGSSGMELAKQIRPHLPDVKIIFITSHIEYAIDAFELSIFRYVPKNDTGSRLGSAVSDAVKLLLLEEGKAFTIQTNSRLQKIPYRKILYIMRDGKNACITTETGVSKVRESLQQVYDRLDAEEFIFIDRGCIVNLIHIMQVQNGSVVLKDGAMLPVSRSHLQAVKEQLNTYWGMHV